MSELLQNNLSQDSPERLIEKSQEEFQHFYESLNADQKISAEMAGKFRNFAAEIRDFVPDGEQSDLDIITKKSVIEKEDFKLLDAKLGKLDRAKIAKNPEKLQNAIKKISANLDELQQEVVEGLDAEKIDALLDEKLPSWAPDFVRSWVRDHFVGKFVSGADVSWWKKTLGAVAVGVFGFFGISFWLDSISSSGGGDPDLEIPENPASELPEDSLENVPVDPEKMSAFREKLDQEFLEFVRDVFGTDVLTQVQMEKFATVKENWWKKREPKLKESFGKSQSTFENALKFEGEGSLFDSLGLGVDSASAMLDFLAMLDSEGLVSQEDLALEFIEEGGKTFVKIGLGAVTLMGNTVGTALGMVPFEELYDAFGENLGQLDSDSKLLFYGLLYRKSRFAARIAEKIGVLSGHAVSMLAGNSPVEFKKLSRIFTDGPARDLKKLAAIEKNLGSVGDVSGDLAAFMKKVRTGTILVHAAEVAKNQDSFIALVDQYGRDAGISWDDIKNKNPDIQRNNLEFSDFKKRIWWVAKSSFSNARLHSMRESKLSKIFGPGRVRKNLNDALDVLGKRAEAVISPKGLHKKFFQKMNSFLAKYSLDSTKFQSGLGDLEKKSFQLRFHCANKQTAKQFFEDAQILMKESPKAFGTLFRTAPMLLVGSEVLSAFHDPENNKSRLKNIAVWVGSLFPVVGPVMMINDALSRDEESGKRIDPGQMALGGAVLALDGWYLFNAARRGEFLREFVMPATDLRDFGKLAWNGAMNLRRFSWKAVSVLRHQGARKFGIEAVKALFKMKGRIAIPALIAFGAYRGYEEFFAGLSSDEKKMVEELKNDPRKAHEMLKKDRPNLDDDVKEEIIASAAMARFGFVHGDGIDDVSLDDGEFTLFVNPVAYSDGFLAETQEMQQILQNFGGERVAINFLPSSVENYKMDLAERYGENTQAKREELAMKGIENPELVDELLG